MAEFTLQIPDGLASRLQTLDQDPSPRIIAFLQRLLSPSADLLSEDEAFPSDPSGSLVHNEIFDFLLSQPSAEQILAFQISSQAQARLHELLEKNRSSELTPTEDQELDTYESVEHFMFLLKVKAHDQLRDQLTWSIDA